MGNLHFAGIPAPPRRFAPEQRDPPARKAAYSFLNVIQRIGIWPGRFRARLVRLMGLRLSSQTVVAQGVFFSGTGLTTEGDVAINVGCHINAQGPIHIESGVRLACGVKLITATHQMGPPELRADDTFYQAIRIGRGCWIGAGVMVLPGVRVASGCMIAAGAVVARDTEPNGLYAGVPARRVKELSDDLGAGVTILSASLNAIAHGQ